MLLSSIEIQGFKSFADKTVLKFGKGVTAVVGPNGSGKSNISDAVRWVLGEQSTKNLRGQSMEDVIFGGTETRRPYGFCEVTLNVDNTDRTLNFDNDFVSISRKYYRSHESEYAINGVSVRLKDIHELFMDTGLGRDGYSMIGQGKIDTIISSKSGERRDIFEEASGISKYRYRKLEAEKKLAGAEDNLLRLHDILDELKGRVGPLEEQSKKAEKFLELADKKRELEIGLWLYTLNNSKEMLRNHENKIAAVQYSYNQIENELAEFDKKVEQNTAYFTKLTSDIEGERLNISSTNEEILKKNNEIVVFENNIKHNSESIQRLLAEKESLTVSDTEANEKIAQNNALIEAKSNESDALSNRLSDLEGELTSLLSDSDKISRDIELLIRNLNNISSESANVRVKTVTAETEINQINARKGSLDENILSLKSEIEQLSGEFCETEKLLEKCEEVIESNTNTLKGYELRLESKNKKADELKAKLDEIGLDIEARRRRVQILTELENNMEGFGNSVKAVIAEAEKGLLKGICGPVSKLIRVPKEYSVAIETALAASIQNIVTETEADAKRAIAFLKNSSRGRATFLPVETIKAKDIEEKDTSSLFGFVGIASDLVETNPKYREIVKYLLGGTFVAEDIDTATAIAKKYGYKVKIVTLDGQVINVGGSLTGGSLVKNAGLLSRASDIEKLNNDIEKLKDLSAATSKEYTVACDEVAKVKADITVFGAEITTANEDKIRALAELKRIDDLKQNAENSLKVFVQESLNGDKRIAELKEIVVNSSSELTSLEGERAEIQSQIDSMSGGRDTLNGKREELSAAITEVKLSIIEIGKDIEQLKISNGNLTSLMDTRVTRAAQIENEIDSVTGQNDAIKQLIAETNLQIDSLQNKVKKSEAEISDMLIRRNETEKSGVELRGSEREKTLTREKLGGELARLNERKTVMMSEYDEVIRKLYDEYSLTRSEAQSIAKEPERPSDAKKELSEIKGKIRNLGNVNVSAIEEYKEVKERFDFLSAQIDDVEATRKELHKLIGQLTSQMTEIFSEGFARINENFSKTFGELLGGGQASLTLSDPDNILESGIDINVKLPGKNVPSLDGLSGGEKALIALSIYFSIMRVNAPPFCFLDEVDTALDDINVDRFADYMKQGGFSTQFICVTHRRGTMEAADMLYGVTMQEKGVTKLLELNVSELEKKLSENNQTA